MKYKYTTLQHRCQREGAWPPVEILPPQPGSIKLYCKKRRRRWYCRLRITSKVVEPIIRVNDSAIIIVAHILIYYILTFPEFDN